MPEATPSLIAVPITASGKADQAALAEVLMGLAAEDSRCRWTSKDAGKILVESIDETHLDHLVGLLKRVLGRSIEIGAPQILYRETIGSSIEIAYTHKKLTPSSGEFAKVKLRFAPLAPCQGVLFESSAPDFPEEYVSGVERGVQTALAYRPNAQFPVTDIKATLLDGAYHATDSSVRAFELAAQMGTRAGLERAGTVLLEPLMLVQVVTPTEFVGSVVGDLKSRRGQIRCQHARDDQSVVNARVPLANMFGYNNQLRSFTGGRGVFTMNFDRYEEVPWGGGDPPFRPAMAMRA